MKLFLDVHADRGGGTSGRKPSGTDSTQKQGMPRDNNRRYQRPTGIPRDKNTGRLVIPRVFPISRDGKRRSGNRGLVN